MKLVTPKVFLIGETKLIDEGFQAMLDAIGVPEWTTDGESDTEVIVEAAGKLCYMSFSKELNLNLTKTGGRNNYDYIQEGIIGTKHGCYDAETEVLTADGWKAWPDVSKDDKFATRTKEGYLEYRSPHHLVAAPYKGRMYRTEARGVDLMVTDNHNMLVCPTTTVEGRKKESFSLVKASELGHVSHAYVKTADWHAEPSQYSDALLTILGFAIGDGHVSADPAGVMFSLRKERKVLFLRSLCKSLGWAITSKTDDKFRVAVPEEYRNLFKGMYDSEREKIIPSGVLMSCSKSQLECLLLGLMQSDGHHGKTGDSYGTTSQTLAGQIQQLCLHVGVAANVCYTYDEGKRKSSFGTKPLTRLSIIRRELKPEVNKFVDGIGKTSWVENWEGMVYCAEVPNNTLYVRRNGIPVWCGNSVLEHVAVNIVFLDVSRVFTHELVRHRVGAAYSQTSGRYVRTDELAFWMPQVIRENIELAGLFEEAIVHQEETLRKMVEVSGMNRMNQPSDFARKKELTSAFRRIVGNGVANNIQATYNHRALRHLISLRTNSHAEEEIRLGFNLLFDQLADRYPSLYADAQREMINGHFQITFTNEKV